MLSHSGVFHITLGDVRALSPKTCFTFSMLLLSINGTLVNRVISSFPSSVILKVLDARRPVLAPSGKFSGPKGSDPEGGPPSPDPQLSTSVNTCRVVTVTFNENLEKCLGNVYSIAVPIVWNNILGNFKLKEEASQLVDTGFCILLFTAGTEGDQNGLDHPSVEVSLDENAGVLVDGFERTLDGKLKCRYCNYASKGTARLIEHIRIHTGMTDLGSFVQHNVVQKYTRCVFVFILNVPYFPLRGLNSYVLLSFSFLSFQDLTL